MNQIPTVKLVHIIFNRNRKYKWGQIGALWNVGCYEVFSGFKTIVGNNHKQVKVLSKTNKIPVS